jgi:hypothetical protein
MICIPGCKSEKIKKIFSRQEKQNHGEKKVDGKCRL